jgi:tellurite resistance protein TerC
VDVSPLIWWLTIGIASAVLLVDVLVIGRRPHEPSRRELIVALGLYIGLAVIFGIGVYVFSGPKYGTEFFAG